MYIKAIFEIATRILVTSAGFGLLAMSVWFRDGRVPTAAVIGGAVLLVLLGAMPMVKSHIVSVWPEKVKKPRIEKKPSGSKDGMKYEKS